MIAVPFSLLPRSSFHLQHRTLVFALRQAAIRVRIRQLTVRMCAACDRLTDPAAAYRSWSLVSREVAQTRRHHLTMSATAHARGASERIIKAVTTRAARREKCPCGDIS